MILKDYLIIDPHGMHARPATALLRLARQFKSEFSLKKDGNKIQMKSMLNILSLALKCGDTISVIMKEMMNLRQLLHLIIFLMKK